MSLVTGETLGMILSGTFLPSSTSTNAGSTHCPYLSGKNDMVPLNTESAADLLLSSTNASVEAPKLATAAFAGV